MPGTEVFFWKTPHTNLVFFLNKSCSAITEGHETRIGARSIDTRGSVSNTKTVIHRKVLWKKFIRISHFEKMSKYFYS